MSDRRDRVAHTLVGSRNRDPVWDASACSPRQGGWGAKGAGSDAQRHVDGILLYAMLPWNGA
jgi:hypothetical protein